jgi:hypothetical protein
LYWNIDVPPEEEDELIKKIAEKIHRSGMEVPAILLLETVKPLTNIGSQMGRFFFSPFLPLFGDEIGLTGEKLMRLFENRENVEKILKHLETLSNNEEKNQTRNDEPEPKKIGWRRIFPF